MMKKEKPSLLAKCGRSLVIKRKRQPSASRGQSSVSKFQSLPSIFQSFLSKCQNPHCARWKGGNSNSSFSKSKIAHNRKVETFSHLVSTVFISYPAWEAWDSEPNFIFNFDRKLILFGATSAANRGQHHRRNASDVTV